MRKNRAFTLIELLIVIGIIAVLTTILIPVITTSIAQSHITVCATKLSTIVDAFQKYGDSTTIEAQYKGFPRLSQYGDPDAIIDATTDGNLLTDLSENTMQNMWLLMREGFLPASAFECPGDGDYASKTSPTKFGWDSWYQFSYGIQNPYAGDVGPVPTVTNLAIPVSTTTYKANYIFAADMNPGGAAATEGFSNHGGGCNVTTRNGNVSFHQVEGVNSSVVYGEEVYDDEGTVADDSWPDSATDVVITPFDPLAKRALE